MERFGRRKRQWRVVKGREAAAGSSKRGRAHDDKNWRKNERKYRKEQKWEEWGRPRPGGDNVKCEGRFLQGGRREAKISEKKLPEKKIQQEDDSGRKRRGQARTMEGRTGRV